MCLKKTMESKKIKFSFNPRKITKQQWIILLLAGLILATIALPVTDTKEEDSGGGFLGSSEREEEQAQKSEMELQLEQVLSEVEGVGKTSVLLTMEGEENQGFYTEEKEQKVAGVLIVAQGAGDSRVERKIQQAVMALFQIEAHKIKVMKMK